MRDEFGAVPKLELPITYLEVWQKGEVAWFGWNWITFGTSTRKIQVSGWCCRYEKRASWNGETAAGYSSGGTNPVATLIPALAADWPCRRRWTSIRDGPPATSGINVAGEWDITEVEDNKHYRATLDALGNGSYS